MGDYHNQRDLALIALGINLAYFSGGLEDPNAAASAAKSIIRDILEADNKLQKSKFEAAYDYVGKMLEVIAHENTLGEITKKKIEQNQEPAVLKGEQEKGKIILLN
jgi:hypothetical protein